MPILPEEVEGRVRIATNIVREVSGVQPLSFRCPRLWGSSKVLNKLEELGYISDASFPLYFYGKPFVPYHPSEKDWTQPGQMKILEIPNFCDLTMESQDQSPFFGPNSNDVLKPGMMVSIDVSFFGHPEFNGVRIETGYEITENGPVPLSKKMDALFLEKKLI